MPCRGNLLPIHLYALSKTLLAEHRKIPDQSSIHLMQKCQATPATSLPLLCLDLAMNIRCISWPRSLKGQAWLATFKRCLSCWPSRRSRKSSIKQSFPTKFQQPDSIRWYGLKLQMHPCYASSCSKIKPCLTAEPCLIPIQTWQGTRDWWSW